MGAESDRGPRCRAVDVLQEACHSTEEIWECRIQRGSNAYRIFCFFDGNAVVVLTHGLIKKTRKTPVREIERAEAYRRDYLQRRLKK